MAGKSVFPPLRPSRTGTPRGGSGRRGDPTRPGTPRLRNLILQALQSRAPQRMSVSDVIAALAGEGVIAALDRKRIERSLRNSRDWSSVGILAEGERKNLRYWTPAQSDRNIPEREGVTLVLAARELLALLPPTTQRDIETRSSRISARLKYRRNVSPEARWLDQVRIVPRIHPQVPPVPRDGILSKVQDAMMRRKRLSITYHSSRLQGEYSGINTYTVSILGLVHQSPVFVLVALQDGNTRPFPHNLDRILDATVLESDARSPAGFNLDDYIEQGNLHHSLSDDRLELQVRTDARVARIWKEQKLSRDQRILREHRDGGATICATVPDTFALRAYLLGFGHDITILGPPRLVEHFRSTAAAILKHHPDGTAADSP